MLAKEEDKNKTKRMNKDKTIKCQISEGLCGVLQCAHEIAIRGTLCLVMHVYCTFVYLCVPWYLVEHFVHSVLHLKH